MRRGYKTLLCDPDMSEPVTPVSVSLNPRADLALETSKGKGLRENELKMLKMCDHKE